MDLLFGFIILGGLGFGICLMVTIILRLGRFLAGRFGIALFAALLTLPLAWVVYEALVEFPRWQASCFGNAQQSAGEMIGCSSAGDMFVPLFGALALLGLMVAAVATLLELVQKSRVTVEPRFVRPRSN